MLNASNNRLKDESIGFLLLAMLLLSIAMVFPVVASPADSMWIEPTTVDGNAMGYTGAKFNVTVWFNVTTGANSWQFYLTYDKNHLQALRGGYTGVGKSLWSGADPVDTVAISFGSHDATRGYVLHGEVLKASAERNGSGSLSWVEFEIIAAPGEGETFESLLRLDVFGIFDSFAMTATFNDIVLAFGSSTYICTWEPAPPPEMQPWLEVVPHEITVVKPTEFETTIYIRDLEEGWKLIGLQFNLTYDSTVVEAIDLTVGPFMGDERWAIHGTYPIWRFEEGRVIYGELILPNTTTGEWDLPRFPSGEGLIATISFRTITFETTSFNISVNPLLGEYFADVDGEYIPFDPPKHCRFTYDTLPLPTLAITPSLYISHTIGESFEIDVAITNIDSSWNLTYVEAKLGYNGSLVQVLNVTEGNFMAQFGNTMFTFEEGVDYLKITVNLTDIEEFPSGSGIIARIIFNATSRPPASCPLLLHDTLLKAPDEAQVLHELSDGYYEMHEILIHEIAADTQTFYVVTMSNGSVTPVPMHFNPTHRLLSFNVAGYNNMTCLVKITIPRSLIAATDDAWLILVGGTSITPTVEHVNSTHVLLSFTFGLSTKPVQIIGTWAIPEIPPNTISTILFVLALIGAAFVIVAKPRKRENRFTKNL